MTNVREAFLGGSLASGEEATPHVNALVLTSIVTLVATVVSVVIGRLMGMEQLGAWLETIVTVAIVTAVAVAAILSLRMRVMQDERLGWVVPGLLMSAVLMYLTLKPINALLHEPPSASTLAYIERALALHVLWHLTLGGAVLGGLHLEHRSGIRRAVFVLLSLLSAVLATTQWPSQLALIEPFTAQNPQGGFTTLAWIAVTVTGIVLIGATISWIHEMGRRPPVAHAWVGVTLTMVVVDFLLLVNAFRDDFASISAALVMMALAFTIGLIGQGAALRRTLTARITFERQVADRMDQRLSAPMAVESCAVSRTDITRVLRDEDLRTVFQPIVDLESGQIVGHEALSRFPALSDGTNVTPDLWFDAAEAAGLGTELELLAAARACELSRYLPGGHYVAVNLSPQALLDPRVDRAIASADPKRLQLEITEHAPVHDYAALNVALGTHRARGIKIAIDDAGAGFSGLQHITQLAPEVLKIDISIVRDVDTLPLNRAMVAALVAYADRVGTTIVAEGVETIDEAQALRRMGVHRGQGWLFGRPTAIDDVMPVAQVLDLGTEQVSAGQVSSRQ